MDPTETAPSDPTETAGEPREETPVDPPKPKKNPGGRPPGSKNRKSLERELAELRRRVASDPFEAPVRTAQRAAAPVQEGDAPAGGKPAETPPETPEEADEPLGEDGARALAPMYYGLVNFGSSLLIKNSPKLKEKPAEAAKLAALIALDPTGHYDAAGNLCDASVDRQMIDPALVKVLAKVKLSPEWALLLATGGVLLGKYAFATNDPEIANALQLVQAVSTPPATPATPAAA
jgi:ribosomal protein S30